tara:strand:+ start:590 stop:1018 length:429 start_codon:yes stop_codon:yes gene_type:complete
MTSNFEKQLVNANQMYHERRSEKLRNALDKYTEHQLSKIDPYNLKIKIMKASQKGKISIYLKNFRYTLNKYKWIFKKEWSFKNNREILIYLNEMSKRLELESRFCEMLDISNIRLCFDYDYSEYLSNGGNLNIYYLRISWML